MKKYKVVLTIFEDGETNPDARDLVNINDSNDRIMVAPDNFNVGDILTEDEFRTVECNYTDEQGYGVGTFAFELGKTEEL
jgi:hypothetical protein